MSGLLKGTARILQLPPMSVVASNIDGKKFIDVPLFRMFCICINVTPILHKYYRNVTRMIVSQKRENNNGNEWKYIRGILTIRYPILYKYLSHYNPCTCQSRG